jgi:protein tyrosine kinase 6
MKGEILHIDKNDKFSDDEWFGSLCLCNISDQQKTFRKGGKLSPHNIATFTDLEKEPWFFGALSRPDAENYLKLEPNQTGSYLIRFSLSNSEQTESNKFHFYTLSVRDSNHDIKHYKIYLSKDAKNHTFYSISPKVKLFKDIKELIHHFKNKLDGLCAILTEPCSMRI